MYRCGDIFDAAFVARMLSFVQQNDLSAQTQSLLTLIQGEAKLGCLESTGPNCSSGHAEKRLTDDIQEGDTENGNAAKRLRWSSSTEDSAKQFCTSHVRATFLG